MREDFSSWKFPSFPSEDFLHVRKKKTDQYCTDVICPLNERLIVCPLFFYIF